MAFVWDPIYALNLFLCIIILSAGLWTYKKKENKLGFFTAISFGLFGFSHLAILLGLKEQLTLVLLAVRTLAYLIIIYGIYTILIKDKNE